MAEKKVGEVIKFFAKPSVAAIKITEGTLTVGDTILIKGHTTDFQERLRRCKSTMCRWKKRKQGNLLESRSKTE